jgi:hypothetical protein
MRIVIRGFPSLCLMLNNADIDPQREEARDDNCDYI